MSSEVEICNEALTAVGENPILSLEDNIKTARLCKLKYENKRDYLLRRHIWNFATKRVTLSSDVAIPEFEFDAQFTLPSDCIQFREVYPNSLVYSIENNKILCGESVLYVKYTSRVTDTNLMDSIFRETLSALLARELAIPLVDSATLYSRMDELFEVKLAEARFAGSIEQDLEVIAATDWENSRY